ncbi:unnamed protein product [Bursaphelenchus xylophilus]|uniref:(pine wood nematode) hypothetical protein n=1 Tax=Bursaphelenchus xylophilus TaxID=6326 RepID=A0A1I7S616_BURXY|nr:unnamed protein product [Bursaphelenchus xylophilus]CAG9082390.1 unnamed protein product [Bursaphelenchus xylophilus]
MKHHLGFCSGRCQSSRQKYLQDQINVLKDRVNQNREVPYEFYGNPDVSDFQIQADGKTFHVTKNQLALKSKVFKRMFTIDMKEKTEGVMRIDADAESVGAMLEYIYMFRKVKGNELARKVVQLAHCYEIDDLKEQCELEILETLTVNDAEESLLLASQLRLPLVFLKCNEFLFFNFIDFCGTPISLTPPSLYFNLAGDCVSYLTITNHSQFPIVFKLYVTKPSESLTDYQIVSPNKSLTLSPSRFAKYNKSSTTGEVYFTSYVHDSTDYDLLHILPNTRCLPIDIF